ncbi:hypothetical protein [Sodalis sp. (in: enterobacteria)]|uniref:hypothetical protein n=1 Tax=Sodalis sp. (in: enterobacteria) TaxID=1898979 RepID=UPI003F38BCA9
MVWQKGSGIRRSYLGRANNSRLGHSIIAREIVLKRRRDFRGGKAILAWLTSPEAGFRCVIFVPSASGLWLPISVATAAKERRRMTSAGKPSALLPVYTATQVLA